MIGAIDCTAEQKEQIREKMRLWYEHRWRYHYAVMELPFIAMGRAVHRSRHFTWFFLRGKVSFGRRDHIVCEG